ncbi:rhamnulokinase [Bacillus sp. 1P06AnD]|uniref:rhamnulokinase n=1 Tax=Bacillus sp. 1P06AnD TaxID=3132208 RepID=UPI0039A33927
MRKLWAFDLGASNGRLMVCKFDGERMDLEETHRFENSAIHKNKDLHWNIPKIIQEMKYGMEKSKGMGHSKIDSMGIDTWGVDFGLLSNKGVLLGNPYCYRDPSFSEGMKRMLSKKSKEELFFRTGIEPSHINTLTQLFTLNADNPSLMEKAKTLLFIPNLLNYLFTGIAVNEFTISSTSQMLDLRNRRWDSSLLNELNIPLSILTEVVESCSILGKTLPSINSELFMEGVTVINASGHDTACAVAALPMKEKSSLFMSCGTWTLMGLQVPHPIITKESFEYGLTNEGTMDGEYRLQKNNMGLWLIQQCRSIWKTEGKAPTFEEERLLLNNVSPFRSFIDPDDDLFFNPDNMVEAIRLYCKKTNQKIPATKGELIACIIESLVFKHRLIADQLEEVAGYECEKIYIGGGGSNNHLYCQFIANVTNKPVHAGPVEASAIGNSISQLIALGEIASLHQAREIVESSFKTVIFEPENHQMWQEGFERFLQVIQMIRGGN